MKLNQIQYRKKSAFYGQKGMSWHGSVVHFRWKRTDAKIPRIERKRNVRTELDGLFIHHLVSNDTIEDTTYVLNIVEAVFIRVSEILQSMRELYLLKYNATCYTNNFINAIISFIAERFETRVIGFAHSKAQLLEGPADANFAIALIYLHHYVITTKNNVLISSYVFVALWSHFRLLTPLPNWLMIFTKKTVRSGFQRQKRTELAHLGPITDLRYGEKSPQGVSPMEWYVNASGAQIPWCEANCIRSLSTRLWQCFRDWRDKHWQ